MSICDLGILNHYTENSKLRVVLAADFSFFFKLRCDYVVQVGLKFPILLPWPAELQDYRHDMSQSFFLSTRFLLNVISTRDMNLMSLSLCPSFPCPVRRCSCDPLVPRVQRMRTFGIWVLLDQVLTRQTLLGSFVWLPHSVFHCLFKGHTWMSFTEILRRMLIVMWVPVWTMQQRAQELVTRRWSCVKTTATHGAKQEPAEKSHLPREIRTCVWVFTENDLFALNL